MFCQVWSTYVPSSPGHNRKPAGLVHQAPNLGSSNHRTRWNSKVPQCKCLASLRFGSSSWWVHKIGVVTDLVTWWDRRCQVTISHKLHHFRGVSTKVIKYFTVHGMDSHRKIIVFFQLMDRGNCFLHYTLTRLLYILGTLHCIHMYTLSTFNIVRISSIYVDYWVYLLTYFELTLSILCIFE